MLGFARDLGIDLGTSNLLIYQKGRGIVVAEPSLVATSKLTGETKAFGTQAREMLGRTPDTIETVFPVVDGAIANYTATEALLRHYFAKINGRTPLWKPRVVVSVPSCVTGVERQAVLDACRSAGAKDAFAIEEPMAAALGLGLGIGDAEGNLVVDIGGGTTDVAVVSLGGIVVSDSVRIGGNQIDAAIHQYMKREHGVLLGQRRAEEIKWLVGSASPLAEELETEVRGRDLVDGMPKMVVVTSEEIREAIAEPLNQIISKVRSVLERTPPELVNDIALTGMWLSGGGALLKGIEHRLEAETGVKAQRNEEPLNCVANGCGRALEQIDALSETHFTFVGEE